MVWRGRGGANGESAANAAGRGRRIVFLKVRGEGAAEEGDEGAVWAVVCVRLWTACFLGDVVEGE